jgi:hypothetical protein
LGAEKYLAFAAIQMLLCVKTLVEENRETLVSASCEVRNKISWYSLELNVFSDLQHNLTLRSSIQSHFAVWEMKGATKILVAIFL